MPECSKALSGHICSAIVAKKYQLGKAMPEWHVNDIPANHSREAACLQQCLEAPAVAVPSSAPPGAQSHGKHLLQHPDCGPEEGPPSLGLVIRDREQNRRELTLPYQYNCFREEYGKEHKVCQHTERWEL